MYNVDAIRNDLIRDRRLPEGRQRDAAITGLLSMAMLDERRRTGAATEGIMRSRYGFTAEEIARHRDAALDDATERFVGHDMVDPVHAAA